MEITAEGRAKINSTIAKVTGDRKYREAELLAELYVTQFQVQKLEEANEEKTTKKQVKTEIK